jgi:hypothetical protein
MAPGEAEVRCGSQAAVQYRFPRVRFNPQS